MMCMMMFIAIFFLFYFYLRSKRFMNKLCPKKNMSCIVVYPRNLITLKDTAKLSLFWSLFPALDVILVIIFRQFGSVFSPKIVFLANNIIWLFLCDIFNLCVSLYYLTKDIPCKNVRSTFHNFYVRKPVKLEPRRNEPITVPERTLQSSIPTTGLCVVTHVLPLEPLHTGHTSEASMSEFRHTRPSDTSVPEFRHTRPSDTSMSEFRHTSLTGPSVPEFRHTRPNDSVPEFRLRFRPTLAPVE